MPFAFSQVTPLDTGRVSNVPIPLGTYLGVALEQGVHDSAFNSIMNMTEYSLSDEGRLMAPEEANEQYGMVGLKFDRYIREDRARLLRARREAQMRRDFYLTEGAPGGLLSRRGVAGLGASVVGSMMNPLDFALNFLPVVGSEAAAAKVASLGRGAFRQSLARGVVTTEEALARAIPSAPRLTSSLIQGVVGNVAAEIPHFIATVQSKEDYTFGHAIVNVAAGTILGGAIHLGVTAAAKIFDRVTAGTREEMFRRALDQTLRGEEIRVEEFVRIDEGVIREKVRFDAQAARAAAMANVPMEEVRRAVFDKLGENVTHAAIKLPSGEVKVGAAHWLIPLDDAQAKAYQEGNATRGFMTSKGRFITEDEAAAIMGKTDGKLVSEESTLADPEYLSDDEREVLQDAMDRGFSEAEALNFVRGQRKRLAQERFFAREDVQRAVEDEQNRRVQEVVEAERKKWDEEGRMTLAAHEEIRRQINEGRTLTPEARQKWGFTDVAQDLESATATVKEQQADLRKRLEDELKSLEEEVGEVSPEEIPRDIFERAQDILEGMKIKKPPGTMMEGVTGMPVWLWNGAIDAVIAAVRAGKAIKDAIEEGVKFIQSKSGKGMSQTVPGAQEGFRKVSSKFERQFGEDAMQAHLRELMVDFYGGEREWSEAIERVNHRHPDQIADMEDVEAANISRMTPEAIENSKKYLVQEFMGKEVIGSGEALEDMFGELKRGVPEIQELGDEWFLHERAEEGDHTIGFEGEHLQDRATPRISPLRVRFARRELEGILDARDIDQIFAGDWGQFRNEVRAANPGLATWIDAHITDIEQAPFTSTIGPLPDDLRDEFILIKKLQQDWVEEHWLRGTPGPEFQNEISRRVDAFKERLDEVEPPLPDDQYDAIMQQVLISEEKLFDIAQGDRLWPSMMTSMPEDVLDQFRAQVAEKLKPFESMAEKKRGTSRRGFLDLLGKAVTGVGLTPSSIAIDVAKNLAKGGPGELVKNLLPNKPFMSLFGDINTAILKHKIGILGDVKSQRISELESQMIDLHYRRIYEGEEYAKVSSELHQLTGEQMDAVQHLYEKSDSLLRKFEEAQVDFIKKNFPGVDSDVINEQLAMAEDYGIFVDERGKITNEQELVELTKGETGPFGGLSLKELDALLRTHEGFIGNLAAVEAKGLFGQKLVNEMAGLLTEIGAELPDIANLLGVIQDKQTIDLGTKAIDAGTKGHVDAIESALKCLLIT